ncbi:MAG: ATP-binding protein [Candidatus Nealsonbacteria bacterium]|nr:ATP-binding protein [Candidatus Nealsonbacteria bacterium]
MENDKKIKTGEVDLKESQILDEKMVHEALLNILEDVEDARIRAVEEKNKTLAIITNFSDGLLAFDEQQDLILINPSAEDFFEVKAPEVIGKSLLRLAEFPRLKGLIDFFIPEAKEIFRKELKVKEILILEVSIIHIKRGKEIFGNLVILHDITREKEIERIKSEFVSLTAHQLRTPLSAIKWTLKMILDGDLGKISKDQKEYLQKTYVSNERMIHLINDLLNVSRIEEGKYLYRPAFVQLDDLTQSVINSYKSELERRKIKLVFEKSEKLLPKVKIDVEKINLVITNFLDNAVKYTPSKGEVKICLNFISKNKEIEFSIKDSGIGIPDRDKKRLFTKFFRSENAVRMETDGSGLGLFITKNIIEAHGGRAWFESEVGKGSTFYFTLPVSEEPSDHKEESV